MKLKNVFCIEAVKIGAAVETYFNSDKYDLSIDDEFKAVLVKDKFANEVYISFSANIKHFSSLPEVSKSKKAT